MKTNAIKSFISALVISLSFLFSTPALAIRSVGNGGGFAELQFVYYFENAKYIVQFCLQDPSCQLDSEQKNLWGKLLSTTDQITSKYNIGFVTTGAKAWTVESDKVVIYSPGLYDSADVTLPGYKILSYAIAIQLSLIQNLKDDFAQTLNRTEDSLKGIQFQNRKVGLTLNQQNIYFHQLKIKLNEKCLMFFALEDEEQSYLLNETLLTKYPNIDLNSVSFSQISSGQINGKGMFFGFVNAKDLGGAIYQNKKIRLQFELNSHGQIDLPSIEFDLALK